MLTEFCAYDNLLLREVIVQYNLLMNGIFDNLLLKEINWITCSLVRVIYIKKLLTFALSKSPNFCWNFKTQPIYLGGLDDRPAHCDSKRERNFP